jgi:transposase
MPTILPDPAHVRLELLSTEGDTLTLLLRSKTAAAECPLCAHPSRRIHSHYVRTLADLPWNGTPVRLRLTVRRFFCANAGCQRRIFAEQLPAVAARYARRTHRLSAAVELIGLIAGGEAGARLLVGLAMAMSPDTVVRAVRSAPLPELETPRVLGVDDFAFRRGKRYGTILVDLERRCRVDLPEDRRAETLARWLTEHPGVEIISRDRGGAYADGGRRGAPDALQVADRFHVIKNLREMVERFLVRNHRWLRDPEEPLAQQPGEAGETADAPDTELPLEPAPRTRPAREAAARRTRRVARYEEVHRLRAEGLSLRAIATQMGLARGTVHRFARTDSFPERQPRGRYCSILDPYEAYVRQRWDEGCQNATRLWRELREQGFTGSRSNVRARLAAWRTTPAPCGRPKRTVVRTPLHPPVAPRSPRTVSWLVVAAADDLEEDDRLYLDHLRQRCPEADTVHTLVHEFLRLVRERDQAALDDWLGKADESGILELTGFTGGIQRDRAAIDAMLTTAWSNGQTEGQVNRLKTIKRTMYGRAKFDLLRQRVLFAG